MKVSDLISLLSEKDPDARVFVGNGDTSDWLELDEDGIEDGFLQPSEISPEIYVRSAESYPSAIKAVKL